jgi:hypothetical protein
MADRMKGKWLPPGAQEHVCKLPWLSWGVKVGARWECQSPLGNGKRPCGMVWRVEIGPNGDKQWFADDQDVPAVWPKERPAPRELAPVPDGVRRAVTVEELDYWLSDHFNGEPLVASNWVSVARYLVEAFYVEKDA